MSDIKLLAKDLRIGNLHYYRMADDFDDRKEWTEISVIDADDILWLSKNDDPDYSPIPLSEDVLVKNFGFEKKGIRLSKDWFYLWLKDGKIIFALAEMQEHTGEYLVVDYIHSVQNLYKELAKKELIYTP